MYRGLSHGMVSFSSGSICMGSLNKCVTGPPMSLSTSSHKGSRAIGKDR